MRVRLLSLILPVAAVAFLGIARADDAKKEDKKPQAKKDCDGDGCCDGDKAKKGEAAAKKDEDCEDGCCEKKATASAKQLSCDDCAKDASGVCAKCKAAVKSGAVSVLPIKGMMCDACSGKVASKLEKIDEVGKLLVSSQKGVAVLLVAPGKMLKLSQINAALEGSKFAVDEEAPLAGRVTIALDCGSCPMCDDSKADKKDCCKDVVAALGKVAGVAKASETSCDKTKATLITLELADGAKVSIKQLRDTVASAKMKIADLVMFGAETKATGS